MDHKDSINNDMAGAEEEIFDDSEVKELVGDSCTTNVIIQREPFDRFNIVYLLFYFFGITSLMPWNFLITANDYWMYKFRDTRPLNGSVSLGKTEFQAEFTSYLNMATALPNMTFLILNSLFSHLIPLNLRMGGSLLIITISFFATTAFVQINTDDWQTDFFIITLTIVAIMTAASAVLGGSLLGIAGKFAPQYMAAVVSGQALGGIIAAVAQILSLAFKISALHSALIYFLIADVMIVASLISYICLCKIDFFTHHILKGNGTALNRNREVSYVVIMKKIWVYLFSIGVIFVITISVYPAITVLIESHNKTKGSDWNSVFFVPVVNYLIFNCSDYAGRIVAGLLLRPFSKAWIVGWASALRVIGVPLLMMCNAQPRTHLPVIIQSDWQYIILMVAFAFSNGYLTNITFINSAKIVDHHEKEKASSMMAAFLAIGLTVGAALSMGLVKSL